MPKKICVITGSRAEYGLLYWLLKAIKNDPAFTLQLIVTCMHLSSEFGLTYKQILEDGFTIDEKLEMLLSSDTAVGITKSIGLAVVGFADTYARLKPDLIVLLGDRFETLAAAQAALIAKIPVAHIHGGELTLGAYDDAIRHSVTKMSHLHFVATEVYQKRVIQLGEQPDKVHFVGAMVIDSVQQLPLLTKKELEQELGITFKKSIFAVTYHPETLSSQSSEEQFSIFLQALATIENTTFIFTKGNADSDGRILNEMIDNFCEKNSEVAKAFFSLGQKKYLSLLKQADLVVGNSSSAIIEAPYFRVPTVNIGDRQTGRIQAQSIINCVPELKEILLAIQKGLSEEMKLVVSKMPLPYGEGNVAQKIMNAIKATDLSQLLRKNFYDKDFTNV